MSSQPGGQSRSPVIVLLVGLVILFVGGARVAQVTSDQSHFAHPASATGTVIGTRWERQNVGHHRYARVERPHIRFTSSDGQSHTFYGPGARWEHPTIGSTYPVQYDPKDPSYARTGTGSSGVAGWKVWSSWLIAAAGALVVGLSIYLLLRAHRAGNSATTPKTTSADQQIPGPYQAGPAPVRPAPPAPAPPVFPQPPPPPAGAYGPGPVQPPPPPAPPVPPQPSAPPYPPPARSFRLPGQPPSQS